MRASSPAVPIHYTSHGSGRALVVLHGLPLDLSCVEPSFEPVFSSLDGWRRIYLDLPGHGGSPGADWIHSNDDMADAVGDFLEALLAGQRFALAGQSYGGYIARALAHRFAEQMLGLMLWVPSQYPRETRHPPPRTVLREDPAATSRLSTEDEQQYGRLLVIQGSEGVTAIQELIVPATKHADQTFLGPVTGSKFSFDPEETPFPYPTLIVCGRQDMLVGYRDQLELIERYPRATVAILDYAGHFLGMTEENQVFRMLVADWLRRIEAATADGA